LKKKGFFDKEIVHFKFLKVHMKIFKFVLKFFVDNQVDHLLPDELLKTLGLDLEGKSSIEDFVEKLNHSKSLHVKLKKFMTRREVENTFLSAEKKEHFSRHSLYSYYFSKGWLGFFVSFDQDLKLRRVYLQYKSLRYQDFIELYLDNHSLSLHEAI
jgi:hypothetical protein